MEKLEIKDTGDFELRVGLEYHKIIDYDRKRMTAALRKGAAEVRKQARRLVSRKAISKPGEYPGLQSGALRRAIGIVSRGSRGGWVKVGVRSIPGSVFYPAFLFYGTRRLKKEFRGFNQAHTNYFKRRRRNGLSQEAIEAVSDQYIEPRGNYLVDAAQAKRNAVREMIKAALKESLVPR